MGKIVFSVNGFAYREIPLLSRWGLTPEDLENGLFPDGEKCKHCGSILTPGSNGEKTSSWCSEECRKADLKIDLTSALDNCKIENCIFDPSAGYPEVTAENSLRMVGYTVWFKRDAESGIIVDVMATSSVVKELALIESWMEYPPNRKYEHLSRMSLSYHLVSTFGSWEEALVAEAVFAISCQADMEWWTPSPEQWSILGFIRKQVC